MLIAALEAEDAEYVDRHRTERDDRGHARVVRNGRARARKVTVGASTVEVQAPRVHDRRDGERFTGRILPPYMRRSPKVSEVLPVLYLRGLSTGDFQPALEGLLGEEASGLSAGQRAGQAAEAAAAEGEEGATRDHAGSEPGRRGRRDRPVRSGLRSEVPEDRGVAAPRPGPTAHVLRLSGGALEAPAHQQPR
jgi:hypothetical protein